MEERDLHPGTRGSDGDRCSETMRDDVVGSEGEAVGKWVEPTLEVLS